MTSIYDTPGLQSAVQSLLSGSTGAGTDVAGIVKAMVNAKVAGQNATLATKQAYNKNQTSAIGTLKAALSSLQNAAKSLGDGTTLAGFIAKGDGKGLTATAGKDAVAGSYAVTVDNIATAQTLSSAGFDAKAKLGEGTLKLTVGGKEISVDITEKNNTLAGVASAINTAAGSAGVTATIVTGTDGAHLVLRSTSTGVDNRISVSVNLAAGSSDTALAKLNVASSTSTVDPRDPTKTVAPHTTVDEASGWTQSVAGQDASLTVSGTRVISSSNKVENAIAGVTLSLGAESVGTTQTLSIDRDITSQKVAVTAFVVAYNNFVNTASALTAFDPSQPAGAQGGPLLGDSVLNGIRNELANIIGKGVGTGKSNVSLNSIGVSQQADGQLKIDDAMLTSALTNNPDRMAALFNSTTGVAATTFNRIDSYVKTGGVIDSRLDSLTSETKGIADQQKKLGDYADQLSKQYNAQFTALNNLMAQMNSNSRYLTQLFGNANNSGALNAK